MKITVRHGLIALVTAAAVAASLPTVAAGAASSRRPRATDAWLTGNTAGRGLRLVYRDPVAAAVGKVFATLGGTGYACSGVLVRGGRAAVVLTAAHCASRGGRRATNWTFVPGYRNGTAPYGQYVARRFYVSPHWTRPGRDTERYDIAFVRVAPAPWSARSRLAPPPRGLPVRFARSQQAVRLTRAYVFGYPAQPPFSGGYPDYCAGPASDAWPGAPRGDSVRTACGMTAGDSGGPWLAGFRPRAGTGTVVAITTFKLAGDPRVLYGAVLGPAARALYRKATGQPLVSRGR